MSRIADQARANLAALETGGGETPPPSPMAQRALAKMKELEAALPIDPLPAKKGLTDTITDRYYPPYLEKRGRGAGAPIESKEYVASREETLAPLRERAADSTIDIPLIGKIGFPSAGLSVQSGGQGYSTTSFEDAREQPGWAAALGQTVPDPSKMALRSAQAVGDMFSNTGTGAYATALMAGKLAKQGLEAAGQAELGQTWVPSQEDKAGVSQDWKTIKAAAAGGGLLIPAGLLNAGLGAAFGKAVPALVKKAISYGAVAPMLPAIVDIGAKVAQDPKESFIQDPLGTALTVGAGYKTGRAAWEQANLRGKRIAAETAAARPINGDGWDSVANIRRQEAAAKAASELNARSLPEDGGAFSPEADFKRFGRRFLPEGYHRGGPGIPANLPPLISPKAATSPREGVIEEPGQDSMAWMAGRRTATQAIGDVILGRRQGHAKAPEQLVGDLGATSFRDNVVPFEKATPTTGDWIRSKLPQSLVESWDTPHETQGRLQRAAGVNASDMTTVPGLDLARLHELQRSVTDTPEAAQGVLDVLRTMDPELTSMRDPGQVVPVSRLVGDVAARNAFGEQALGEQVRGKHPLADILDLPDELPKLEDVTRQSVAPEPQTGYKVGVENDVPFRSHGYQKNTLGVRQDAESPHVPWLDEAQGRNAAGVENLNPVRPSVERQSVKLFWPEYAKQAESARMKAEQAKKTGTPAEVEAATREAAVAESAATTFRRFEESGASDLAKKYVETALPVALRLVGRTLMDNPEGAVEVAFRRILNPEQAQGQGKGARFSKTTRETNAATGATKEAPAAAVGTVTGPQSALHAVLQDLIHDLTFHENMQAVFKSIPDATTYSGPTRPVNFEAIRDSGTRTLVREAARTSGWFPKDYQTRAGIEKIPIPEAHANLIEYLADVPDPVRRFGREIAAAGENGMKDFEKWWGQRARKFSQKLGQNPVVEGTFKVMRNAVVSANWPTRLWNAVSNFGFGEMMAADYGTPSPRVHPVQWAGEALRTSRDIYRGNLGRQLGIDPVTSKPVSLGDALRALEVDPTRLTELKGFGTAGGIPILPGLHGMTVQTMQAWKRAAGIVAKTSEGALKGARESGAPGMTGGMFKGAKAGLEQFWKSFSQTPETTYEMGMFSDLVHRVPAVKFLLDKGWGFNDAIRIVKEGFLDYSNANNMTKAMSKWVVPFFTFSAKATPKVFNYAVQNPGRALMWMLAGRSANLAGGLANGMDEEEWQRTRDERGIRHSMAIATGKDTERNFSRGSAKTWYIDVGMDFVDALMRGASPVDAAIHSFMRNTGIPGIDIVAMGRTGIDPKTHKETFGAVEGTQAIVEKFAVPPYVSGLEDVFKRLSNPELSDRSGYTPDTTEDLLYATTGNRERGVNLAEEERQIGGAMGRDKNRNISTVNKELLRALHAKDYSKAESLRQELRALRGGVEE